jgi:hypothetical protein
VHWPHVHLLNKHLEPIADAAAEHLHRTLARDKANV